MNFVDEKIRVSAPDFIVSSASVDPFHGLGKVFQLVGKVQRSEIDSASWTQFTDRLDLQTRWRLADVLSWSEGPVDMRFKSVVVSLVLGYGDFADQVIVPFQWEFIQQLLIYNHRTNRCEELTPFNNQSPFNSVKKKHATAAVSFLPLPEQVLNSSSDPSALIN